MENELFIKGVEHFNRGNYFEAHEFWEELWNEASGARHAFLQGLIQIAAALHHATRDNFNGTRKLFARSLQYLEEGKSASDPIAIEMLKDCVLDFELAVQRRLSGENNALPYFQLPMMK